MAENKHNATKNMFDCLVKLYKQGQLLLMDADRLMGEKGWEPMHTTAPADLSKSLNSSHRWYARWAARFYIRAVLGDKENMTDQLLFLSIHFASAEDTAVDEPIISAGRLLYDKPMSKEVANDSYDCWMCKYWFWGKPHEILEGWHQTGPSKVVKNLKGTQTFIRPLYDITSSEKLEELVIKPLLSSVEQVV